VRDEKRKPFNSDHVEGKEGLGQKESHPSGVRGESLLRGKRKTTPDVKGDCRVEGGGSSRGSTAPGGIG